MSDQFIFWDLETTGRNDSLAAFNGIAKLAFLSNVGLHDLYARKTPELLGFWAGSGNDSNGSARTLGLPSKSLRQCASDEPGTPKNGDDCLLRHSLKL